MERLSEKTDEVTRTDVVNGGYVVGTNEVKQGADDRKVDGYEKVE